LNPPGTERPPAAPEKNRHVSGRKTNHVVIGLALIDVHGRLRMRHDHLQEKTGHLVASMPAQRIGIALPIGNGSQLPYIFRRILRFTHHDIENQDVFIPDPQNHTLVFPVCPASQPVLKTPPVFIGFHKRTEHKKAPHLSRPFLMFHMAAAPINVFPANLNQVMIDFGLVILAKPEFAVHDLVGLQPLMIGNTRLRLQGRQSVSRTPDYLLLLPDLVMCHGLILLTE
jgi:hypothetical protein